MRAPPSNCSASVAYGGQQLPILAAVEGPAACFRLLEIDEDRGMTHEQFVGLLMSATDNRMTLEDTQEAWERQAKVTQCTTEDSSVPNAHPSKTGAASRTPIPLPAFLQAFGDLARAKYRCSPHGGEGRSSVNRLLLRDVFDNITSPCSNAARYGVCAHMTREDICSFLLSQKSFSTKLFATYFSAGGWSSDDAKNWVRPSLSAERNGITNEKWELAVSRNGCWGWADFLAMASDLQLIPRLIGVAALKAAVEEVSTAPHRVRGSGGLADRRDGFVSYRSGETKRSTTGLSYPQLIEVLSLLARASADRLRALYPDVAEKKTCVAMEGPPNVDESAADSVVDSSLSHNGRSTCKGNSTGALSVGDGGVDRNRGKAGKSTRFKAAHVRAAVRLNASRGCSGGGPATISSSDARAEQTPPYDLGALKALFHHARITLENKCSAEQGCSRVDPSRSAKHETRECSVGPAQTPWRSDDGVMDDLTDEGRDVEGLRGLGDRGRFLVGGHDRHGGADLNDLPGNADPAPGSPHVFDRIAGRVSELEEELFPCDSNTGGGEGDARGCEAVSFPNRTTLEEQTPSVSSVFGAGGSFARLVVIKELQPVPEHAPDDVRDLLELALGHHQAGRYVLALETVHKARISWGTLQDGEQNRPPRSRHAEKRALNPAGGALLDSVEASVHQSAGNDPDALSALLRADRAINSLHRNDLFLREAGRASVLSEMGVALYYCNRPALSLRCFRLALVLRQQILQNSEQHIREAETRCPIGIDDDFTKGTPRYRGQHSDTVAAEAGEAAAAISLNNIGVCLAGIRKTCPATQALLVSSRITNSSLGVDHPRSAVIARNLGLVKAAGSIVSRDIPGCRDASSGGRRANRWEDNLWHYLGNGEWNSHKDKPANGLLYKGVRGGSHVIPGGFFISGKLPQPDECPAGATKGRRKKGGATRKKRGKSARRR